MAGRRMMTHSMCGSADLRSDKLHFVSFKMPASLADCRRAFCRLTAKLVRCMNLLVRLSTCNVQ